MSYASCCILSFNRPQFLATAVSTLLEHADADLELIIHDDGSTDPSVYDLLHRWQQSGVVSTVILNPPGHNQGQGTALNRMFSIASGDPIIKLDQDLVFKPGWLRTVNEILAHNREYATGGAPDGEAESPIGLLGLFHYLLEPVDSRKTRIAKYKGWSSHTHICGSGMAIPRGAWEALGPFEEHSDAFAEDWAFQQKVTQSGLAVCGLPDEDLVRNQGFGVGPSTVVVAHDGNEGTVQKIHHTPAIHPPARGAGQVETGVGI